MRRLFDIITAFMALFFFCHGLGVLLFTQLIDNTEIALSLSLLTSFVVTIIIMTLDILGVFDKRKKKRETRKDILDDIEIKEE